MAKVAVGYGVVGSGVVDLFYKNKHQIEKKREKRLKLSIFLISGIFQIAHIRTSWLRILIL